MRDQALRIDGCPLLMCWLMVGRCRGRGRDDRKCIRRTAGVSPDAGDWQQSSHLERPRRLASPGFTGAGRRTCLHCRRGRRGKQSRSRQMVHPSDAASAASATSMSTRWIRWRTSETANIHTVPDKQIMIRAPSGLVDLAVDEPECDPTPRRSRAQLAETRHIRSYLDYT